jgi:hypothetical protein
LVSPRWSKYLKRSLLNVIFVSLLFNPFTKFRHAILDDEEDDKTDKSDNVGEDDDVGDDDDDIYLLSIIS